MTVNITDKTVNWEFIEKIREISGEDVYLCMQCGACAGACPMRELMDVSSTRLIALIQMGLEEEAKDANTVWLCASCHTCEARCPRGLDLPKVMEAIRLLRLRHNENQVEPNQLPEELVVELPPIVMVAGFRKLTS